MVQGVSQLSELGHSVLPMWGKTFRSWVIFMLSHIYRVMSVHFSKGNYRYSTFLKNASKNGYFSVYWIEVEVYYINEAEAYYIHQSPMAMIRLTHLSRKKNICSVWKT